jgi:hypothetical protein
MHCTSPRDRFKIGPCGISRTFLISMTMPIASALKKYYMRSFLEVPTGFLNRFWVQVAVSLLKPPHGRFRSETAVT